MFSQIKQTNDALFLTNPKEIYNKIVEASKIYDKSALQQLLQENGTLDILYNGLTPAGLLASQGNNIAVWFLYNNFYINMKSYPNRHTGNVIYGATLAGHTNLIDNVITICGHNLNQESAGYARSGNYTKMYEIITEIKDAHYAIKELARTNRFDLVDQLLESESKGLAFPDRGYSSTETYLKHAVYGAVLGGFTNKMNEYIDNATDDYKESAIQGAIQGAAEVGNITLIQELINRFYKLEGVQKRERDIGIAFIEEDAIEHAAISGHFSIVHSLLTTYLDNESSHRRFRFKDTLPMIDALFKSAFSGAVIGGHFWIIKQLKERYPQYYHSQDIFCDAIQLHKFEMIDQLEDVRVTVTRLLPRFGQFIEQYEGQKKTICNTIKLIDENNLLQKQSTQYEVNELSIHRNLNSIACSFGRFFVRANDRISANAISDAWIKEVTPDKKRKRDDSDSAAGKMKTLVKNRNNSIHYIMTKFKFNLAQALLMLDCVARVWLLQARNKFVLIDRSMPNEIFNEITRLAFLDFGLNINDIDLNRVSTEIARKRNNFFNTSTPKVEDVTTMDNEAHTEEQVESNRKKKKLW